MLGLFTSMHHHTTPENWKTKFYKTHVLINKETIHHFWPVALIPMYNQSKSNILKSFSFFKLTPSPLSKATSQISLLIVT